MLGTHTSMSLKAVSVDDEVNVNVKSMSMSLKVFPVDDEVEIFEADKDLVSFALQPVTIRFSNIFKDPIRFSNSPQ